MGTLKFLKKEMKNEDELLINFGDAKLKEEYIDYMDYFFKQTNNRELSKTINNNLECMSNEDLVSLAKDILSVTFNFMRTCSSKPEESDLDRRERFYRAVMFHLSDAVHNIPTNLDVDRAHIHLIDYITEFFVFVDCLERLENRPRLTYRPEHVLFSFHTDLRK